ncbi:two-component hybrid sensor and regulator [Candidatus Vecturithrix granuli]|uniref:Two-component hybrid sensor and regulator n=1 Tax=Vecturithrix granuli TaxID=1499967 RepID=A0A081C9Y5_VECG1|nr:two-component hybrid sensor and regulator [Candidatus Vecturithrix granuli]
MQNNDQRLKQTVLIVDDMPENLALLDEALGKDYRIKVALHGEKAIKIALSEDPPDLILLDIIMPEIDGYDVCRRLKADDRARDIPIMFVTGKREVEDEIMGFRLGAVDYIMKPISPPIVRARVKNHLELIRARRQLEAQNKMLLETAQLREDVEQMTRHDLKNPLNAILSYPQLIEMVGELNDQQQQFLRAIEIAGFRMLNMINRSLDMIKMERGIYTFQSAPMNLIQLFQTIIKETQEFAHQRNLWVEMFVNNLPVHAVDGFIIYGEELLCYSMFANLLRNALEASPPEHPIVINLTQEQGMAAIRIQNTGTVPESIRDRFFEKYVTFGKHNGTGLGTYSARLIAGAHGGSVQLDASEPGSTTVIVRLPIHTPST